MQKLALVLSAAMAALLTCSGATVAKQPMTEHRRVIILRQRVDLLAKEVQTLSARQLTTGLSPHTWPHLSAEEKTALASVLKTVPKATKFDIICNTASCDDLAEDIDDALEKAGLDSMLDRSLGPLGYGVDITVNAFDRPAAEKASAALKAATDGRLDLPVSIAPPNTNAPGYVTVRIGKYRPN